MGVMMARRNLERPDRPAGTLHQPRSYMTPWVFPFDRARHERARRLLGPDRAGTLSRPTTTAEVIDLRTRELDDVCGAGGWDRWVHGVASASMLTALMRLADVEERHLVLVDGEPGHDTLTLAELAVAHRRQLMRHVPVQRGLLGLALVLLTHQLHAAGRLGDAVATGQEAVDLLTASGRAASRGDTRPALVLALDVSLMTCLANGRREHAVEDLIRATRTLDDLVRDDPGYRQDLVEHVQVLTAIGGDAGAEVIDVPEPHPRRSLREPVSLTVHTARSAADELYDEGVRLATSDGDGPAAAAAAGAAVTAYRRLLAGQPAEQWYASLRRLARALWRHAIVLSELLNRPRDAMAPGREALALTRRTLRVVESPEDFDELVAELGVRLHDLGTIAGAAKLIGEHDQLIEEVRRIDVDSVGHDAMRALGATLHDRAAEACETTVALAERGRSLHATVQAGLANSARAITVRRAVVTDDPVSLWELANSQLAHGHLRCLNGDGQMGAQAMADAYRTVRQLAGPAGQTMREATEAALLTAVATFPDIVPHDDWLQ